MLTAAAIASAAAAASRDHGIRKKSGKRAAQAKSVRLTSREGGGNCGTAASRTVPVTADKACAAPPNIASRCCRRKESFAPVALPSVSAGSASNPKAHAASQAAVGGTEHTRQRSACHQQGGTAVSRAAALNTNSPGASRMHQRAAYQALGCQTCSPQ